MTDQPAFPQLANTFGSPVAMGGMTLREWYAGMAMQGIVGSIGNEEDYQRLRAHAQRDYLSVSQWIARESFKQANVMIAASKDADHG